MLIIMLPIKETRLLNLLFATSIIIFIGLGPVSLSFPIGLYFLYLMHKYVPISITHKSIRSLTILACGGVVSSILSPMPFSFSNTIILAQMFYWLMLATCVGELYPIIDKVSLSKTIAVCCIILGLCNILFGVATQNSVAFTIVILGPLGVFGFKSQKVKIAYMMSLFVIMIFNESRTGFAITSVQMFIIGVYSYKKDKIKQVLLATFVLLSIFISSPILRMFAGSILEPYNEEVALLLTSPDEVNAYDKSWIQRQVQVQKGIQIFQEHPILGVGPLNFTSYQVKIDLSKLSDNIDPNELNAVMKHSENRSAHNSYVTLLAEFGIVGFICWTLFILTYIITSIKKFHDFDFFDFSVFVAVLGLSVYFYTIAGFYGTSTWLLLGLMYGTKRRNQNISCF